MPLCPIKHPEILLPHSGNMVLLDQVLSYDEHSLTAQAHIDANHILLPEHAQALPSYLGIEILAQAIGAWAGAHALDRGDKVRLGFLLGTRKLSISIPSIPLGTDLWVKIDLSWQDESGMGVFDGKLIAQQAIGAYPPNSTLLECALNVFSPPTDNHLEQLLT